MRSAPILLLAYNRPEKLRRLVDSLRVSAPATVMVAVDGPKPDNASDEARVLAVREIVKEIDWTANVDTLFRPENLGLRRAVAGAVSWAIEKHGEVIVLEEDAVPGPLFIPYATNMLDRFRDDARIAHISGYNLVDAHHLSTSPSGSRLTRYPESFAWATWGRAWRNYDEKLQWGASVSIAELAARTGSRVSALRWKQHFSDAIHDRIGSWAYRWISSYWSLDQWVISPNRNLVTYAGYDEGTNSILKAPWVELPLFEGELDELLTDEPVVDSSAERWVGRRVFGESVMGLARGFLISRILAVRKVWRRRRAR